MSLFNELKRRNVLKVAVAYIIVAWLLLQISDTLIPALRLPEWFLSGVAFLLIVGFPVAIIFAWAFELTPEGFKKEEEVDSSDSMFRENGKMLNFTIIAVLAVAVIFLAGTIWLGGDNTPQDIASAEDKSIAVLPFENHSADAENAEFFAAGVHDELLTLLSKLRDLKVISRTSVQRLDQDLSIAEIGALLGVATVLEGQVQRAGDRLRINVKLIKVAEEDQLWAQTYDTELSATNIFDVQSDIARAIASELHLQLSARDDTLLNKVPTNNTEALERYMLGRQHFDRSSWESLKRARAYFTEATDLDPEYVQAWAAIAGASASLFGTGAADLKEFVAIAEPAIARALELDHQFPEAHAHLATLRWRSGDLKGAESSFKRALEIDPNDVQSLLSYGNYLRTIGRPREAILVLEQGLAVDPLSLQVLSELGRSEMYLGHPEKNLEYSDRMLEIDPSSTNGYISALQTHIWMGRMDLAWLRLVKFTHLDADDFESWAFIGLWSEILGDAQLADRYLDRALELGPNAPVVLKCHVQVLVNRDLHPEALAVAQLALEAGLEDRWSSRQTFLLQVRDHAIRTGDYENARTAYVDRYPELQGAVPNITVDNIQVAADLAKLLQQAGEPEAATTLIDAALAWYQETQPPGVHGYLMNIVDVHLLSLRGKRTAALNALREAVDGGWKYDWPMHITNMNLDLLKDAPEFKAIVAGLEADMAGQIETVRRLSDKGDLDTRSAKS